MAGSDILVTGASSGIGEALVEIALRNRAHVRPVVRTEEQVNTWPTADGINPIAADHTDPRSTALAVRRSIDEHGPPTHAFLAAAYCPIGPLEATSIDDLTQAFTVNVVSTAAIVAELARSMNHGAQICLLGSSATYTASGPRLMTSYAASKSALRGLADSAYPELLQRGITIRLATIGACDSRMWSQLAQSFRRASNDAALDDFTSDARFMTELISQASGVPTPQAVAEEIFTRIHEPDDEWEFFVPAGLHDVLRTAEDSIDTKTRCDLFAIKETKRYQRALADALDDTGTQQDQIGRSHTNSPTRQS